MNTWGPRIGTATLLGGMALLMGGWIALSGAYGAVLLLVAGAVALALVLPWAWLLWTLLGTTFVLVGPLQYFAGVDKAFWLPYLMALVMGIRCMGEVAAAPRSTDRSAAGPALRGDVQLGLFLLAAWAACALLSSLLHRIPPLQALVAGKEYFFLWAVPAAFAAGLLRASMLLRLWRWMTLWLLLQVPVVAWQRWFVAPARSGDSPWDAVVGVFAGRAGGGGGSGTMALVSLWAAAVVAMAWREGRASAAWALAAVGSALLACAMAEVKIALLVAPLMACLVACLEPGSVRQNGTSARTRASLASALTVMAAGLALSGLLLWAHQQQFASRSSAEGQSLERYVQTMVERNLDDRSLADPYGQLTRLGALRFWWQQQQPQDVPGWLVGHGIGSARRSHLYIGEAARPWRLEIGRHSASILLWEVGVLGLSCWVAGMAVLGAAAWRMAGPAQDGWLLRGAASIILVALLSLPYGADLFESPHLSTALMLGVGITLAAAWNRAR